MNDSPFPIPHSPLIAMVAGEDSGDALGADLVAALKRRLPRARLVGVGGPRMRAAGFEAWHDISELSVMGIAEVLKHLPRLLRLRRSLARRLIACKPDLFVGIDAPDFNLGLERRLKRGGIRTAHYVSPSIWAWREKRAAKIAASADRVLCLLPMEPAIYARHGVDARFVGHPLADTFALQPDRAAARDALGLPHNAPVLAVLPGSRASEIERLGAIFLDAARRVAQPIDGLRIIVPAANPRCRTQLEALLRRGSGIELRRGSGTGDRGSDFDVASRHIIDDEVAAWPPSANAANVSSSARAPRPRVPRSPFPVPVVLQGHSREALIAADLVLVASGTAALEAMLAKRPMVVAYRIAPLTYRLIRAFKLMQTEVYSLPNILAGNTVAPELMQDDCRSDALADALLALWRDEPRRADISAQFTRQHQRLLGEPGAKGASAADRAAQALAELIASDDGPR